MAKGLEMNPATMTQFEMNIGTSHGLPADDIGDMAEFRFIPLEEFPACRRVEKQAADFNNRTGRTTDGLRLSNNTALGIDLPTRFFAERPGLQAEPADRSNRRQGFATKSHA